MTLQNVFSSAKDHVLPPMMIEVLAELRGVKAYPRIRQRPTMHNNKQKVWNKCKCRRLQQRSLGGRVDRENLADVRTELYTFKVRRAAFICP